MAVYIVTDYCGDKTDLRKEVMSKPRLILGVYSTKNAAVRRKELEERRAKENGFDDIEKFYVEPWVVQ